MQNLENVPANEVCYHWAYAVNLDAWFEIHHCQFTGSEYWQLAVLSIRTGTAWQPINIFQQYFFLYEVTGIRQSDINIFNIPPVFVNKVKGSRLHFVPHMKSDAIF